MPYRKYIYTSLIAKCNTCSITILSKNLLADSMNNNKTGVIRSLPNMATVLPKAPKIYPIHLLLTNNYRNTHHNSRMNVCI